MEAIRNIDALESVLSNEDPLWQRRIFDEIGVVVLPWRKGKPYWGLLSPCGLADLEDDVEIHWVNGSNESSYCNMTSIEQLTSYIQEMDTYQYVLKDVDLGGFNKSDLFWAIYYRILLLNRYSDDDPYMGGGLVYGMRAIKGPGERLLDESSGKDCLWFDTSVCGVDQLAGTYVNIKKKGELSCIVEDVANQIREFREMQHDWDDAYPPLLYDPDAPFQVPSTYDEVFASYELISY